MRTYAGHTTARASNELFHKNLAKGQTGLSIAFDLPTQLGYDSDHPLALPEVGKVGVPICHIEDMEILFEGIPLERMNTSMTINATAMWLIALYVALAERRGINPRELSGTTQNDMIKEYLSRGTYIFPPPASLRLTVDLILNTTEHIPRWNPINICSYHLQEAGATPAQEVAYALLNAEAVLDAVCARGIPPEFLEKVVGRISFFVNAGIRFIEEMVKLRVFGRLWEEITREKYGVKDPKNRLFRYGVQVNSLGLTAVQPENNLARIIFELLAVTLSKSARARAIQLPAWNEALGLPRPWDQQLSLRFQQILAYETDLLEYEDLFTGNPEIARKEEEMRELILREKAEIEAMGGILKALDEVKRRLVEAQRERLLRIERGEDIVVGVNRFTETEPSPLAGEGAILEVNPEDVREQIERLRAFRNRRNAEEVAQALRALRDAALNGENLVPFSIRAAHAGVTTGEWADTLRQVFGEYRAPTGVDLLDVEPLPGLEELQSRVRNLRERLGRPPRLLLGKPGLDGHSNGAEQIAVFSRDLGFEVIYQGIRLSPEEIARAAVEEGVDLLGLSILSGSHLELVDLTLKSLEELGAKIPVVVGGIIPERDAMYLKERGVAEVFTPRTPDLRQVLAKMIEIVESSSSILPA
jgi:(2R)-ethylmalonyl-CoA mutase